MPGPGAHSEFYRDIWMYHREIMCVGAQCLSFVQQFSLLRTNILLLTQVWLIAFTAAISGGLSLPQRINDL